MTDILFFYVKKKNLRAYQRTRKVYRTKSILVRCTRQTWATHLCRKKREHAGPRAHTHIVVYVWRTNFLLWLCIILFLFCRSNNNRANRHTHDSASKHRRHHFHLHRQWEANKRWTLSTRQQRTLHDVNETNASSIAIAVNETAIAIYALCLRIEKKSVHFQFSTSNTVPSNRKQQRT